MQPSPGPIAEQLREACQCRVTVGSGVLTGCGGVHDTQTKLVGTGVGVGVGGAGGEGAGTGVGVGPDVVVGVGVGVGAGPGDGVGGAGGTGSPTTGGVTVSGRFGGSDTSWIGGAPPGRSPTLILTGPVTSAGPPAINGSAP